MKVSLRPAVDADFEACRRTYFAETAWINERLQLKREDQDARTSPRRRGSTSACS